MATSRKTSLIAKNLTWKPKEGTINLMKMRVFLRELQRMLNTSWAAKGDKWTTHIELHRTNGNGSQVGIGWEGLVWEGWWWDEDNVRCLKWEGSRCFNFVSPLHQEQFDNGEVTRRVKGMTNKIMWFSSCIYCPYNHVKKTVTNISLLLCSGGGRGGETPN